jgi:hypothetical protein
VRIGLDFMQILSQIDICKEIDTHHLPRVYIDRLRVSILIYCMRIDSKYEMRKI